MGDPTHTAEGASTAAKRLLTVDEARSTILAAARSPDAGGAESVSLRNACGRVLARDVVAGLSMPRWPNSAMDGYALRLADAGAGTLPVRKVVAAGDAPTRLEAGSAARIYTGAPVPEGADTVVMQEDCSVYGDRVHVDSLPELGANIRGAAEDFTAGDTVLRAGQHLRPQHVALAASAGAAILDVHPRLRVTLLITGDELAPPGAELAPGEIHESNGHMLAALAEQLGVELRSIGHLPDEFDATCDALSAAAADSDLIITSGGASVGDCDHTRRAAEAIGELALFGVAVKPGKPLAFGGIGDTHLLVLPGNPVSLYVTFLLFGAPLVRQLQGRIRVMPEPLWVPAGFEQTRSRGRADYIRVRLEGGRAIPCGHQGSGVLTPTAAADGLACIPPRATVATGEPLAYYPLAVLLD